MIHPKPVTKKARKLAIGDRVLSGTAWLTIEYVAYDTYGYVRVYFAPDVHMEYGESELVTVGFEA